MMLHTKYQGSMPCRFREEDFFTVSLNISLCKRVTPGTGPFLATGELFEQTWYRSTR